MSSGNTQWWRSHHLSGQAVPVWSPSLPKLFSFCPAGPCCNLWLLVLSFLCTSQRRVWFCILYKRPLGSSRLQLHSFLGLLFSMVNTANSLSLSLYAICSSPWHLSAPPLDPLQFDNVPHTRGGSKLDTIFQMCLPKWWAEISKLDMVLLMQCSIPSHQLLTHI